MNIKSNPFSYIFRRIIESSKFNSKRNYQMYWYEKLKKFELERKKSILPEN